MRLVHMPKEKMTAEENAIRYFQDESYFDVLVESIARKSAEYAYAKIKEGKIRGTGNQIDCIIRRAVFGKIDAMDNARK